MSTDPDALSYRRLKSVVAGYKAVAVFCLNLAVVLALANVLAAGILAVDRWMEQDEADPVYQRYGEEGLFLAYPDKSPDEVRAILKETWSRGIAFEPFTQVKEAPFRGRYVNVDSMGFRHSTDQGPWPPAGDMFNVFLFGGSTAFSYGLPDDETVASELQRRLSPVLGVDVRVYNFGRAFYYSTLERILFEQLLSSGQRPDLAIFLDGLNDFGTATDRPPFSDFLEQSIRLFSRPPIVSWSRLPLYEFSVRGAAKLRRTLRGEQDEVAPARTASQLSKDLALADGVIRRMGDNMRMIRAVAQTYEIPVRFVIQPVPTYGYDLSYHRLGDQFNFQEHALSGVGYVKLASRIKEGWGGSLLTWCGEIQRSVARSLYVDNVHYGSELAGMVADCIVQDVRPLGVGMSGRSNP